MTPRHILVSAASVLISGTAAGQLSCASLDLNQDGVLIPNDFIPALTQCVVGNMPHCDFNGDGVSDAIDYAFYIANFDRCYTNYSLGTRTTLPILTTEDRLTAVDISEQVDIDAGYREYEIRFQLPAPDAELIAVTESSIVCDAPPCFVDPQNSSWFPLDASQVASLGVTGDTYATIGWRTGDDSLDYLNGSVDNALFAAGESITAGVMGWSLFPLGTIDTPTSPGLGSADGNIDNTVVVAGIASIAPSLTASFSVAYTLNGELFVNTSSVTIGQCLADTNGDGVLSPADFSAWVAAFNAMSSACDQNGDGVCSPADFSAWVANYNAGC